MTHQENRNDLSSELTYHRYIFSQVQINGLFREITVPEYIALHLIAGSVSKSGDGAGKTYLKDIADELHLSVPKTSKMIGELRDKGWICWGHDGNGKDGTYVTVTASGAELIERQEGRLKDYYGRVIEHFGEDKLVTLFGLMQELEDVMDHELCRESEEQNDG